MQIKLTWKQTNDHLLFDVINSDIALWFVETSQQLGNKYARGSMATDLPRQSQSTEKLIAEISNSIDQLNQFFTSVRMPVITKPDNWCDQQQLNTLHKYWVETRLKWPKLDTMLYKINPVLFNQYHETNCHIHLIENSFRYEFRDNSHWRVDNQFKDKFYNWENCHLSIAYPGHGRHPYEKFEHLDDDPVNFDIDNCNWDNIDAFVNVEFVRPVKLTPPDEFLSWCKQKNLIPNTRMIPIANLTNWQSMLTTAKTMFVKNLKLTDNYFSLEMV